MTAGKTDVVQVIESDGELRADERVCWWVQLSRDAVWLEAVDTSSDVIDVVSPSGDDWVSLDGVARDSCAGERFLESFPGLSICDFLAVSSDTNSGSDKAVLSFSAGVTTSLNLAVFVLPIVVLGDWALSSNESDFLENLCRVELVWVGFELWASFGFDFLLNLKAAFSERRRKKRITLTVRPLTVFTSSILSSNSGCCAFDMLKYLAGVL